MKELPSDTNSKIPFNFLHLLCILFFKFISSFHDAYNITNPLDPILLQNILMKQEGRVVKQKRSCTKINAHSVNNWYLPSIVVYKGKLFATSVVHVESSFNVPSRVITFPPKKGVPIVSEISEIKVVKKLNF